MTHDSATRLLAKIERKYAHASRALVEAPTPKARNRHLRRLDQWARQLGAVRFDLARLAPLEA